MKLVSIASRSPLWSLSFASWIRKQISVGLTAAGFWLGVSLPFVYMPLLLFNGLDSRASIQAFGVLLGLHVLTLIIGHQYN